MRRMVLVMVASLALPAAASADADGPTIVAAINAARAQHGFPADVPHNAEHSDGCRKHNHYMALHGIGHGEDEGKAGYTPEGDRAGGTSVLYSSSHDYASGRLPFESAPLHFHDLIDLSAEHYGAADSEGFGCIGETSFKGRKYPKDILMSYPSPGSTDWPTWEEAREFPSTPGEYFGVPQGTRTGPTLHVSGGGPQIDRGFPTRVISVSLTGPDGHALEVHGIDRERDQGMSMGAAIFVRRPLAPNTRYTASIRIAIDGASGDLTKTWSFTTGDGVSPRHGKGGGPGSNDASGVVPSQTTFPGPNCPSCRPGSGSGSGSGSSGSGSSGGSQGSEGTGSRPPATCRTRLTNVRLRGRRIEIVGRACSRATLTTTLRRRGKVVLRRSLKVAKGRVGFKLPVARSRRGTFAVTVRLGPATRRLTIRLR